MDQQVPDETNEFEELENEIEALNDDENIDEAEQIAAEDAMSIAHEQQVCHK